MAVRLRGDLPRIGRWAECRRRGQLAVRPASAFGSWLSSPRRAAW